MTDNEFLEALESAAKQLEEDATQVRLAANILSQRWHEPQDVENVIDDLGKGQAIKSSQANIDDHVGKDLLGIRIEQLRDKYKWSGKKLARMVGYSDKSLRNWTRGIGPKRFSIAEVLRRLDDIDKAMELAI